MAYLLRSPALRSALRNRAQQPVRRFGADPNAPPPVPQDAMEAAIRKFMPYDHHVRAAVVLGLPLPRSLSVLCFRCRRPGDRSDDRTLLPMVGGFVRSFICARSVALTTLRPLTRRATAARRQQPVALPLPASTTRGAVASLRTRRVQPPLRLSRWSGWSSGCRSADPAAPHRCRAGRADSGTEPAAAVWRHNSNHSCCCRCNSKRAVTAASTTAPRPPLRAARRPGRDRSRPPADKRGALITWD